MAFSPIKNIEDAKFEATRENWQKKYKDAFVETQHDVSQLTLALPDDSLVVFGPPRLSHGSGDERFHVVGFLNTIQYSETRQVQPLKAIGSRRHIFAATNSPVQGSIGRLLFVGQNLLRAFYANAEFGTDITKRNSKYELKESGTDAWYTNVEEDLFRVPFGMGIIYNSPATLAGQKKVIGAEYFEVCTIVSKQMSVQSGQAMLMEQVQFMADRVVPWAGLTGIEDGDVAEPVSKVSVMHK